MARHGRHDPELTPTAQDVARHPAARAAWHTRAHVAPASALVAALGVEAMVMRLLTASAARARLLDGERVGGAALIDALRSAYAPEAEALGVWRDAAALTARIAGDVHPSTRAALDVAVGRCHPRAGWRTSDGLRSRSAFERDVPFDRLAEPGDPRVDFARWVAAHPDAITDADIGALATLAITAPRTRATRVVIPSMVAAVGERLAPALTAALDDPRPRRQRAAAAALLDLSAAGHIAEDARAVSILLDVAGAEPWADDALRLLADDPWPVDGSRP